MSASTTTQENPMDDHENFDSTALTVFCVAAGKTVGVTKTFNRCEGCGSFVH